MLKIKVNRHLYKNICIACAVETVLLATFAFLLGFEINRTHFGYYLLFIVATVLFFFMLFFMIDKFNHKYIVFDTEKIMATSKGASKTIVYYDQILEAKYHNQIDLFWGKIDFGYVEIVYKTNSDNESNTPQRIQLYMSKNNYQEMFSDRFLH